MSAYVESSKNLEELKEWPAMLGTIHRVNASTHQERDPSLMQDARGASLIRTTVGP